MNAGETAKYLSWLYATLPVMEAFAKGEEVQVQDQYLGVWNDVSEPEWNRMLYRIKPKLIERWAVVNPKGYVEGIYDSLSHAGQVAKNYGFRVVHMREVMEE